MATKNQVQAEVVGDMVGAAAPSTQYLPEASSQSFKKGQFIYLASGKITVVADDAVVIWGIAQKDASGTVDTILPVIPLTLTTLISMCAYHATAASAITAVADVGIKRDLSVVSNKCYVDKTDVDTPALVIQGLDSRDVVGDVYGRYLCTILHTALQTIIGA